LHRRKNAFGHWKSGIDDPHFFLAPRGSDDPDAELAATLRAFFDPLPVGDHQAHAQCRYPARYAWLNQQLNFDPRELPEVSCERFEAWRRQMNACSVSLVFASYYMNNPASMYGHTFLRLNRAPQDPTATYHLLDYTANFAADATTTNGILYAWDGLFGRFRGRFSTLPYYLKVQQYNNLESRDLWEYPLHLTPAQVDLLVRHLWEVGQTSMAYYFFNRNCSYQLMPILEAAAPDLELSRGFILKTIPSDTLRKIRSWPGLADPGIRRPSEQAEMIAHRSHLNEKEIDAVEALLRNSTSVAAENVLSLFAADRQALILESAQDLLRYREGFSLDLPLATQNKEQDLLVRRSQLHVSSPSWVTVPELSVAPELGHRTGRVSVTQGFSSRSAFQEIGLRPVLHDLDDPSAGYLEGSKLEMFNTRLRWDDRRATAYLEELSLVNIVSLPEWDRWVRKPSWKVNFGARVAPELDRDPENSLYFGLNFGPGWSARVPAPWPVHFFILADVDGGAGSPWRAGGRFGAGGSAGLLMEYSHAIRLRAQIQEVHYVVGDPDSTTHTEIVPSFSLTDRLDLRVTLEEWNRYKEARVGLFWFL